MRTRTVVGLQDHWRRRDRVTHASHRKGGGGICPAPFSRAPMCPPCLESVSPAPRVRRPNSSSAKRSSCTSRAHRKTAFRFRSRTRSTSPPKRDPSSIGIGITYRKAALRCRIVRDMPLIEVYADIWCPFTHVGLRSVVRRRDQAGRDDVTLRVLSWPLELVNGKPLDPMMTASHVDDLRTQVAPDLFTGFDPKHFPRTTLPALAVAATAYRQGGRVGEAVSLALREALFEQGRDISAPWCIGRRGECAWRRGCRRRRRRSSAARMARRRVAGCQGIATLLLREHQRLLSFARHFHRRRRSPSPPPECRVTQRLSGGLLRGTVTATRVVMIDNVLVGT